MIEKINELLRTELSQLLLEKLELPTTLVTITEVEVSNELSHANVFVSILPENQAGSGLNKLKKLSGLLQKELKQKTRLRHIPRLHWHFDAGQKHASKLDEIWKQLEEERNQTKN
jgi:ribosome-binding factor A